MPADAALHLPLSKQRRTTFYTVWFFASVGTCLTTHHVIHIGIALFAILGMGRTASGVQTPSATALTTLQR